MTLENTEKPKCAKDDECLKTIADLDPSERPLDISGMGADPKCRQVELPTGEGQAEEELTRGTNRFFHKMSINPPYKSVFPQSEIPNVTPAEFQGTWEDRVAEWGGHMKRA